MELPWGKMQVASTSELRPLTSASALVARLVMLPDTSCVQSCVVVSKSVSDSAADVGSAQVLSLNLGFQLDGGRRVIGDDEVALQHRTGIIGDMKQPRYYD